MFLAHGVVAAVEVRFEAGPRTAANLPDATSADFVHPVSLCAFVILLRLHVGKSFPFDVRP
jgi:hypothetical protein